MSLCWQALECRGRSTATAIGHYYYFCRASNICHLSQNTIRNKPQPGCAFKPRSNTIEIILYEINIELISERIFTKQKVARMSTESLSRHLTLKPTFFKAFFPQILDEKNTFSSVSTMKYVPNQFFLKKLCDS